MKPVPTSAAAYRTLGRSGLRVSPLCLGTMSFGTNWGWGAGPDVSRKIFDAYVEQGGNFFDTADFYTEGASEELLGEFISDQRDRFVIGTKYTLNTRRGDPNAGGNHRKNMISSVEASLRRLKTDYIDLYWVHMWDFTTPVEEVLRGLDDLVRAGKVHYIAISDAPAWKIAEANMLADLRGWTSFIAMQLPYSLIQRTPERELIPLAVERNIAVMPWSPLAGGVLTGRYQRSDIAKQAELAKASSPFKSERRLVGVNEERLTVADEVVRVAAKIEKTPAQVALNWLLTRPGVTAPIVGASKPEQIEDCLGCFGFSIPDEDLAALNGVSEISLGFPGEFINREFVQELITGGADVNINPPGHRTGHRS